MLEQPVEPTVPQSENLSDGPISRETDVHLPMAYTFGAFLGDGWTYYAKTHTNPYFVVGISCMDYEIVAKFKDGLEFLTDRRYTINKGNKLKDGSTMWTCSSKTKWVHDLFVGITAHKTRIPPMIATSHDKNLVQEFIAGLFDTDGAVTEHRNVVTRDHGVVDYGPRYILKLGMTERRIIEETAAILQRFGVKVGPIREETKGSYRTMYGIQPNIRSFVEAGFYLYCSRKRSRLDDWRHKVLGASETLYSPPVTTGEDKVHAL